MTTTTCPDCGATVGRNWAGNLRNLSQQYAKGQQYDRGPHADTCAGSNVFLDQEMAASRKAKAMTIGRRYRGLLVDAVSAGTITPEQAVERMATATGRLAL